MSFNYGASEIITVLNMVKTVYEACRSGPEKYQEIRRELKSLQFAITSLSDDAKDESSLLNRKGAKRKGELVELMNNCEQTTQELKALVDQHSRLCGDGGNQAKRLWDAHKVGKADLDSLRGKITFHTSTIEVFLISLQGSAISRIEDKIDKIFAKTMQADVEVSSIGSERQSVMSIASDVSLLSRIETDEDEVWQSLKGEFLAEGISMASIMSNQTEIIAYIKSLLVNATPRASLDGVRKHEQERHVPSAGSSAGALKTSAVRAPVTHLADLKGEKEPTKGLTISHRSRMPILLPLAAQDWGIMVSLSEIQYGIGDDILNCCLARFEIKIDPCLMSWDKCTLDFQFNPSFRQNLVLHYMIGGDGALGGPFNPFSPWSKKCTLVRDVLPTTARLILSKRIKHVVTPTLEVMPKLDRYFMGFILSHGRKDFNIHVAIQAGRMRDVSFPVCRIHFASVNTGTKLNISEFIRNINGY